MPQLSTLGPKIPVTVITGFLGSGKSTLLNYILDKSRGSGRNIAVIENEFGEVNIDKTLVGDKLDEQEDLVSLENGCVCCSLRKDIVKAFAELEKRSRSRNRAIDHILLETTGLADPSPVAFTFFANPWIAARFKLDSITCVVDAKYLLQHLEDSRPNNAINEAVQQLAFSDLILLNKLDLVNEEQKKEVLAAIRSVTNHATIIECQLNDESKRPPIKDVLGTNTFSVQRALEADPHFLDTDSDTDSDESHGNDDLTPAPQGTFVELAAPQGCGHAAAEQEQQAQAGAASASSDAQGSGHAVQAAAEPEQQEGVQGPGTPAPDAEEGGNQGAGTSAAAAADEAAAEDTGRQGQAGEHADASASGHKRGRQQQELKSEEKKPKRRRKKLHDLSDVSSVGITTQGVLDEYRFNMFMRDLLAEHAKDIFRCKGVLAVHGYGRKKFVFQGVHETICYGPSEHPWKQGEVPINQIVFIGKGLDRKMLVEGFRTCLWNPLPPGWHEAIDEKTKKPYYWNSETGVKSWTRPEVGSSDNNASLVTHQTSMEQPRGIAPSARRTHSLAPSASGAALSAGSPTNNPAVEVA